LKLTALNNAQRELVLRLLAFGDEYDGIYDLLTEITEKETFSVTTTGTALASGLSNRNHLRNGYINSRVTISGTNRFVERRSLDKLGLESNSWLAGSDDDPYCYIEGDKYFLNVSVGSYPQTVTYWYVGEPYTLATSASGSGKTQSVATPDLNVLLHSLLTKIAERDLRRGRGDQTDFAQAAEIEKQIMVEIQSLVRGDLLESDASSEKVGQFNREVSRA